MSVDLGIEPPGGAPLARDLRLWVLRLPAGFTAGAAAELIDVQAQRLAGFLHRLDNWGMFKLDLSYALVWGLAALVVAAFAGIGLTRAESRRLFVVSTAVCLVLNGAILWLVAGLSHHHDDASLLYHAIPSIAVGPLTWALCLALRPVALKVRAKWGT